MLNLTSFPLHACTRNANALPSGTEWDFYKSYPGGLKPLNFMQTITSQTFTFACSIVVTYSAFKTEFSRDSQKRPTTACLNFAAHSFCSIQLRYSKTGREGAWAA